MDFRTNIFKLLKRYNYPVILAFREHSITKILIFTYIARYLYNLLYKV